MKFYMLIAGAKKLRAFLICLPRLTGLMMDRFDSVQTSDILSVNKPLEDIVEETEGQMV